MEETPGPSQGTSAAEWRSTDGGLKLTYTQPRLNKKNFVNWALKTQILLEIQGVWEVVSGEDREPARNAAAIRSIQKVADAWQKLRDIHRPTGDRAYYCLMTQVMQLQVNGAASIQELGRKLEELWYELEDVEHKDPEERKKQFKVCLLLNALPTEYEHMVSHMQATSGLTYDEAVKRLRHEELRRENVQE
ncbi:hypothetical protein GP486_005646 [Trichoglossum hirsutum]|uniref:DUF4219 domain-containing protein n=1 Tax=Trichoglossum hirsutum TaxID=265104 RepID=A0A9P8L8T2_9PEZI|nr:hypothetical protein GP486_005646 [Trichoglossum hirsutum]